MSTIRIPAQKLDKTQIGQIIQGLLAILSACKDEWINERTTKLMQRAGVKFEIIDEGGKDEG